MTKAMRAIRVHKFGGPEVLQLEANVPVPKHDHNEVLVRIMSAGVNPVDTYIREGAYARKPHLPYTPGMDSAGIVEDVGKDVRNVKKGDRVFCTRSCVSGSYAEFGVYNSNSVFPLPKSLSFHQGAAIGVPYFTAFRALFLKAHGKAGETVLVHGASGAVGLAAVQIAKAYGLKVFGTAGTEEGLELVKKCGAEAVFNHKHAGYTGKILKATGDGEGVDIVLEMLGNVNLAKDLTMMRQFGRIIIIGSRGTVEMDPRLTMGKELSITGMALLTSSDEDWKQMSAALIAGIDAGWVQPVIDRHYTMEKAPEAHADVMSSSGHKGKLVLAVASEC